MRAIVLALWGLAAVTGAMAQEQATPELRAALIRVNAEVSGNLQCTSNLLRANDKLAELEAELKKLRPQ